MEERLKRQRDKHKQRVEESENRLATLQKDYEKIQEEMKEYELKAAEEKRSHDEIQEKVMWIFLSELVIKHCNHISKSILSILSVDH